MDTNKKKKKAKKTIWKKFKVFFGDLFLDSTQATEQSTETDILVTESEETTERTVYYISASETEESFVCYNTKTDLFDKFETTIKDDEVKKLFIFIEKTEEDKKRISIFKNNIKGKLSSWWNSLNKKPKTWEELKFMFFEDLKALRQMERKLLKYDSEFLNF